MDRREEEGRPGKRRPEDERRDRGGKQVKVTGADESQAHVVNTAGSVHGKHIHNYGRQDPVYSEEVQLLPKEVFQIERLRARTKDETKCVTMGMIRVAAVNSVVNKLSSGHDWVTITGNAGDGKTTVGFLVLNEFLNRDVKVYSVNEPAEYDLISKIKEERVIMFDDSFGQYRATSHKIGKWIDVLHSLSKVQRTVYSKTQVVFISRKNVLNGSNVNLGRLKDKIFECVVDLSEGKLTKERLKILTFHLKQEGVTVNKEEMKKVSRMETAHGFERCCEMFAKLRKNENELDIEEFFKSPLKFLDQTTEILYKDYCRDLFQLMIKNGGNLTVYKFKNDTTRRELLEVQKEQEGSYVTVSPNGVCRFAHTSVYESVLNVINNIDPLYCVQYAALSVIQERMIISTTEEEVVSRSPCYIIVRPIPTVLKALAVRFRGEILKGDYSVFKHKLCEHTEFCKTLVSCCVTANEQESSSDDNEDDMYDRSEQQTSQSEREKPKQLSRRKINFPGMEEKTMLWTALETGNMTAVCVLIKHGADGNTRNTRGKTPLQFICYDDDDDDDDDDENNSHKFSALHVDNEITINTMKVILNEGRGDVNVRDKYGMTPLYYICQGNNSVSDSDLDKIKVILTEGRADVNIRDEDGQTPLHYLCQGIFSAKTADQHRVNIEAIRVIITEGRGEVNIRDRYGKTPLHYLCEETNSANTADQHRVNIDAAIRVIISEGGGDVNIRDELGKTPLHYLCPKMYSTNTADQHRVNINAIQLIITEGSGDVNILDRCGRTPLHLLLARKSAHTKAIELMVRDWGSNLTLCDKYGQTALHFLSRCEDINVYLLQLMLDKQANVNQPDNFKHTPLHYLFSHGDLDDSVLKLVITEGKGDLNQCEQNKSTPLHYLCSHSRLKLDTVDLVIGEGNGDFNKSDEHGSTPLHFLCRNKTVGFDVVHRVINTARGDMNKQDKMGLTPLHYLCKHSDDVSDIVTLVSQGKGDTSIADKFGNTSLHYVCRRHINIGGDLDELNKPNSTEHTPLDYFNDQGDGLPWIDGMIDRSATDLVLCTLKVGGNWTIVLGRAMIFNSERVHRWVQVEGWELTNRVSSENRETPNQFQKFKGTCSGPIPFPPSPSPISSPSYWETLSTLRWRDTLSDTLLEMGVVQGERNIDRWNSISSLATGICVSVRNHCDCRLGGLYVEVRRRDPEDRWDGHQVGECVSLPRPTSGEEVTFTFGLVLDVGSGRIAFIDVERKRLLGKINMKVTQEVYPMFYVDPFNCSCATRMRLISGREISVTDAKVQLIQQALSD